MSNPFATVATGVFACVNAPRGNAPRGSTPLALQICAALARRLASPAPGTPTLDRTWWSEAFNNVPMLSATGTPSGSIADTTPAAIAAVCLGPDVVRDIPASRDALAAWVKAMRSVPTTLNSIAVTGNDSLIHLSLAFVDTASGTFNRTDAVIDADSPARARDLQAVFGSTGPLTTEPYHCSLPSIG